MQAPRVRMAINERSDSHGITKALSRRMWNVPDREPEPREGRAKPRAIALDVLRRRLVPKPRAEGSCRSQSDRVAALDGGRSRCRQSATAARSSPRISGEGSPQDGSQSFWRAAASPPGFKCPATKHPTAKRTTAKPRGPHSPSCLPTHQQEPSALPPSPVKPQARPTPLAPGQAPGPSGGRTVPHNLP